MIQHVTRVVPPAELEPGIRFYAGFGRMSAEPPLDRSENEDGGMTLARATWSLTAFVLFVIGMVLVIEGYIGYAIVTLVIATAAAINLF